LWSDDPEWRAHQRERRYERKSLKRVKRSEDLQAFEEVFDKSTLMIIYKMLNQGELSKIQGAIDAGKESRVFLGTGRKGDKIAVKIFLVTTAEFRKGRMAYIEGDPRFSSVRRDTRSLVYLWAQKEFKNLEACHLAKVPVPKPILVRGNVLLMQFIGREDKPAPLLKNAELEVPADTYHQLLTVVEKMYVGARLVHGDLSEYNVMMWRKKPVIFDLAQAVSIEHPMTEYLLKRDLNNINNYFKRYSIRLRPVEEIYGMVTKTDAE
jgi:RIO kinase 1